MKNNVALFYMEKKKEIFLKAILKRLYNVFISLKEIY